MTSLDTQAQRDLSTALQNLSQGRLDDSLSEIQSVLQRFPESVDARHLLALCYKRRGELLAAEQAFKEAQRLAPLDASIAGNLANLYSILNDRSKAIDAYLQAIELNPKSAELFLNLGITLLDDAKPARAAEAFSAGLKINDKIAALWHGLGTACRNLGELDQASAALEHAVKLAPDNGAAWTALGVVARLRGKPSISLQCYARARDAGFNSLEVLDAEASALFDLGRIDESLQKVASLVTAAPNYAPGQLMRSEILYETGNDKLAALAPFRAAVDDHPQDQLLRKAYASALFAANLLEECLEQTHELTKARDDIDAMILECNALINLGRSNEALKTLNRVPQSWLEHARFAEVLAKTLLCAGDPGRSGQVLLGALQHSPVDQGLLALLGVAWRINQDPRESWLCDYERFIMRIVLRDDFLVDLEKELRDIHQTRREPLKQSLRFGTQTPGHLFGRDLPNIRTAQAAIITAVQAFLTTLPEDSQHPFLARPRDAIRFSGSWSVLLRGGGHHVNHFHQEGWISSAFYIALPDVMTNPKQGSPEEDLGGCLIFGQPPLELGLDIAPRRILRPQRGELVLFPSYFWHGTLPFSGTDTRLTVAFDVVPGR